MDPYTHTQGCIWLRLFYFLLVCIHTCGSQVVYREKKGIEHAGPETGQLGTGSKTFNPL